jgi:predicted dinucleotide-binding enzyme
VLGNARAYHPRPIQFVAGDDARAKASVASLVEDLGFEVRDAGPLKAARLLEPMAMVWIDQAMRYGMTPTHAWALVDAQPSG